MGQVEVVSQTLTEDLGGDGGSSSSSAQCNVPDRNERRAFGTGPVAQRR